MNTSILIKALFAIAMGLAGFLLFQVQPVMAKFILPWFGGSATTWTVCMLFFQVALLLGYAYVYAVTVPLSVRTQAILQIVLLGLALLFLPITPSDALKPVNSDGPIGKIMYLLVVYVGAPYVVLSTTSPLLQRWLAHVDKDMLASRFFALSNLGSFIGLLSYPFLFERVLSSPEQTRWWSFAFAGFAALFALSAIVILRRPQASRAEEDEGSTPSAAERGASFWLWILYSCLGSVLLLATTNQITQWTAVVPFLWILPLSLYLVTFIIAFGHQRFYDRLWFLGAFAVLSSVTVVLAAPDSSADLFLQIGLQTLTMFAGCMICHGEMVKLQPPARRLARFYMAVALGGALGGVIVTLVAPLVFKDYWEHQIAIAVVGVIAILLNLRLDHGWRHWTAIAFGVVFVLGALNAAWIAVTGEGRIVDRIRNFYGVVRVVKDDADDPQRFSLAMEQAGVEQGSQFQAPELRHQPYCAFLPHSGIGRALANVRKRRGGNPDAPIRIGSIGLGVGVLAELGKPGDVIRVYELNPAVTELTNRYFTFVRDSKAKVEITHGDGRILLERELQAGAPQNFDILVVDAFRGASPPLHLMTAEAFDIYLKHLAPDGILAINFEIDVFGLAPLHRGLARRSGLEVHWFETPDEAEDCDFTVSWALYSRDHDFFTAPGVSPGISSWRDGKDTELVWTDASANLMSIINWESFWKGDDDE